MSEKPAPRIDHVAMVDIQFEDGHLRTTTRQPDDVANADIGRIAIVAVEFVGINFTRIIRATRDSRHRGRDASIDANRHNVGPSTFHIHGDIVARTAHDFGRGFFVNDGK